MKFKHGHRTGKGAIAQGPAASASEGAYAASLGATESAISDIRNGLHYNSIHAVQREYDFSDKFFAQLIGISGKTLLRLKKSDGKLSALSADRVYRLKKIRALANKVLASPERALAWLRRPQPGLGGAVPLDILDTEPGYEQVQRLLNQLAYGVLP